MSIKRFVYDCVEATKLTIAREGITCGIALDEVVQGPLVLTLVLNVFGNTQEMNRLEKIGPALQSVLNSPSIRVTRERGRLHVEIPLGRDFRRSPSASDLARFGRGAAVCVGLDARRKPVTVSLPEHGATYWIGPSQRGKTTSMAATLFALVRNANCEFVIVAMKAPFWRCFTGVEGNLGLVTTADEVRGALDWANSVADERARGGQDGSRPLIVVVDDLMNLLANVPEIATPLTNIASLGAGVGVHLLASTQDGGARQASGGARLEANMTARILFGTSSAASAARAAGAGRTGLEELSGAPGDALLKIHGEARRIATATFDPDLCRMHRATGTTGATAAQPWRNRSQPAATGCNRPQPATTAVAWGSRDAGATHFATPTAQPVEPVAMVVSGFDDAATAEPAVVIPEGMFPVRNPAALTDEHKRVLRSLYKTSDGWTLNKLVWLTFGCKDGKRVDAVRQAVTGDDPDAEPEAARLFRQYQDQINWSATLEGYRKERRS